MRVTTHTQAWLSTGKKHEWLLSLYTDTMRDARAKLLQRSAHSGLLFLAELEGDAMVPKMDHLVCFMPGALTIDMSVDHH